MNWLTKSAVAYLNIDVGVSGKIPGLSATPEMKTVATAIMQKILWPTSPNETMYDAWFAENDGEVGVLGSGSDYTSFLHRGISSLDVGSDQGPDDPIYHYHRYVCLPDLLQSSCAVFLSYYPRFTSWIRRRDLIDNQSEEMFG